VPRSEARQRVINLSEPPGNFRLIDPVVIFNIDTTLVLRSSSVLAEDAARSETGKLPGEKSGAARMARRHLRLSRMTEVPGIKSGDAWTFRENSPRLVALLPVTTGSTRLLMGGCRAAAALSGPADIGSGKLATVAHRYRARAAPSAARFAPQRRFAASMMRCRPSGLRRRFRRVAVAGFAVPCAA